MRIELTPPSWARYLQSDLTYWQKAPIPVDQLTPFEIPDAAYFEYAYTDADGVRRPDPDNTNSRLNPWWEFACHLTGPDYRPDPLVVPEGVKPQGRVLRMSVDSKVLGQTRRLIIYSPAGKAEEELPLILFNDGKAYYGWGRTPQVLDRLLERCEVAPAHLVFVPPSERTKEYAFNPAYREFLTEELLPVVEGRIGCDGRRTIWGASLGGLLGAMLGLERPDLFGTVVTQSGAYLFSPDMEYGNPFDGNESFLKDLKSRDPRRLRWHLDCGSLEWLLGSNERVAAALADAGADVTFDVRQAGHNWVNWRNGLAEGLRRALPVGGI